MLTGPVFEFELLTTARRGRYYLARVGYALTLARSDLPRAAQSLRAGLGRSPRPSERRQLLSALGDVLLTSGDYPGAEEAYLQVVETNLGAIRLYERAGFETVYRYHYRERRL